VREQNSAFIDRFSYTLEFNYLPPVAETRLIHSRTGLNIDAVGMMVGFANLAREKARAGILTQPPSIRQLFAWARSVAKGLPVSTAFKHAVVNKFPAECASELEGAYAASIDENRLQQYLERV
jgi:MoxR-like ATPase